MKQNNLWSWFTLVAASIRLLILSYLVSIKLKRNKTECIRVPMYSYLYQGKICEKKLA